MKKSTNYEMCQYFYNKNLVYEDLKQALSNFERAAKRAKLDANMFHFLIAQRMDLSGAPWQILASEDDK